MKAGPQKSIKLTGTYPGTYDLYKNIRAKVEPLKIILVFDERGAKTAPRGLGVNLGGLGFCGCVYLKGCAPSLRIPPM